MIIRQRNNVIQKTNVYPISIYSILPPVSKDEIYHSRQTHTRISPLVNTLKPRSIEAKPVQNYTFIPYLYVQNDQYLPGV